MEDYAKTIFKGKRPTVKMFIRFEKNAKSPEKVRECYYYYYEKGMSKVSIQPEYMKEFLENLITHDSQRFLVYLKEETILGRIHYELADPAMTAKLIWLMEEYKRKMMEEEERRTGKEKTGREKVKKKKKSLTRFALCFQIGFQTGKKPSVYLTRKHTYLPVGSEFVEVLCFICEVYMRKFF